MSRLLGNGGEPSSSSFSSLQASLGAELARLAARWPALPVEVRRALLVLAGIPQEPAP